MTDHPPIPGVIDHVEAVAVPDARLLPLRLGRHHAFFERVHHLLPVDDPCALFPVRFEEITR